MTKASDGGGKDRNREASLRPLQSRQEMSMAQIGFEQELRDDSRVFGLNNWKLPFMELPFIKFE